MKKTYNVGVMGCANIAIRSIIPSFILSDRFNLYGIASRSIEKADSVANEYKCKSFGSYDELLDDSLIDLVYIPLPTGLHYEWIYKALLKKKHVMSEKSLACSYNEVKKLTELAKKNDLLLIENFQFRFHSQNKWVKDFLGKKELGEIRCFRSSFGFPPFKDDNIRYDKELGGGALLDAGAYTVKSMLYLFSECKFKLRSATLWTTFNKEVDIYGGAYFDSDLGIIAELAFGFDNYYQCNYEIWGSKGKLTVNRAFTAPPTMSPTIIIEKQDFREEIKFSPDNHFVNMINHIAKCLDLHCFEEEYSQNLQQAYYLEQIKQYSYENK